MQLVEALPKLLVLSKKELSLEATAQLARVTNSLRLLTPNASVSVAPPLEQFALRNFPNIAEAEFGSPFLRKR